MATQLIFLGGPGSGKGTVASMLKNKKSYQHISTGDLLRAEIDKGSELGLKVKEIMASGALVSDDIVLQLLKDNCNLDLGRYIFDGFPRNIDQARSLDKVVLQDVKSLAIYFDIDLGILKDRLVNRRTCGDCGTIYNLVFKPPKKEGVCDKCGGTRLVHRKDDNEETVESRLKVFMSTISPIIEYYEKKGNLVKVDASGGSEDVFKKVCTIIED